VSTKASPQRSRAGTSLLTAAQHREQAAMLRLSKRPKSRVHAVHHENLARLIEQGRLRPPPAA
jgi:hypothetical protein